MTMQYSCPRGVQDGGGRDPVPSGRSTQAVLDRVCDVDDAPPRFPGRSLRVHRAQAANGRRLTSPRLSDQNFRAASMSCLSSQAM